MIQKQHKKESVGHIIYRLLLMFTGASLAALSIERFLMPNQMIDGWHNRNFAYFGLHFTGKLVDIEFCDTCCVIKCSLYVLSIGGYTDEKKEVIYALVTRLEMTKLKVIAYDLTGIRLL